MTATDQALAVAAARLALAGDRAGVARVFALAADPAGLAAAVGPAATFADTPGRGGAMGVLRRLWDRVTGVVQGKELTATERFLLEGRTLTTQSSNVEEFTWRVTDPARELGDLYVLFKPKEGGGEGGLYRYEGIPLDLAVRFVESDSPGRFVWHFLREGKRPYKSKYNGRRVGSMPANKSPLVIHIED